jgi:hypothetical protein
VMDTLSMLMLLGIDFDGQSSQGSDCVSAVSGVPQ